MKKYFKQIILVSIIAIIVVSFVGVSFFVTKAFKTPIGILDGVYYDMSPSNLKKVLGEPQSITDTMELSEETSYLYTVDINGIPTQICFSFHDNRKLTSIRAYVATDGTIDADKIFENWLSKLYAAYKDKKGFFCDEIHKNSDTDYEIELGMNYGATGLYCSISVDESGVCLTCTNLW